MEAGIAGSDEVSLATAISRWSFRVSQRYQHVLDKVDPAHAPALDWNFKRNLVDI
jgi:hypothetical protein